MQTAACLHNLIANVVFPKSCFVTQDATTFDATNHMIDINANTVNLAVLLKLLICEFTTFRFLVWLMDRDTILFVPLKAFILPQLASIWQDIP